MAAPVFTATDVAVANLALGHLQQGVQIVNLTDNTAQALALNRYYATSRDEVLRDFEWPFATRFATLKLVQSNPLSEYRFAYQYPADCLKIRRIPSGIRNDNRQTVVTYKIGQDPTNPGNGLVIYTDWQNAVQSTTNPPAPFLIPDIEYTSTLAYNTALWPPDFIRALSLFLASEAAVMITKGDQFGLGEKALAKYKEALNQARCAAMNEERPDQVPESEFVRVRSGWYQPGFPANSWSPFGAGFFVQ